MVKRDGGMGDAMRAAIETCGSAGTRGYLKSLCTLLLFLPLLHACATARTYNDPRALRTISGKLTDGPNIVSDHEICEYVNSKYSRNLKRCWIGLLKITTKEPKRVIEVIDLNIIPNNDLGDLMQVDDMAFLPEQTVGAGNLHIVDVHCGDFAVWDLRIEDRTYVVLRAPYNEVGQLDNSYLGRCQDEQ